VLVTLGGGELRAHALAPGAELMLGRDLDCDVVLDHHRVSRRHARLRVAGAGDSFAIEDLGSRNGTRVGEALRPHQPCPVRAGDAIGIGPFTLTPARGPLQVPSAFTVEESLAGARSPALLEVARGPANVLVRDSSGSDGSGPGRAFAEALHRLSGRSGRLVALDCAALGLAQGATERELLDPALEEAARGTLLLEEIGELTRPLQARLLQVIEGDEAAVRLICTTRRDLVAPIEAGMFRLDLYYRLAGATLTIPSPRVALAPDEEAERRRIFDALARSGGSRTRAARLLGISRSALAMKLAGHGIARSPRTRR